MARQPFIESTETIGSAGKITEVAAKWYKPIMPDFSSVNVFGIAMTGLEANWYRFVKNCLCSHRARPRDNCIANALRVERLAADPVRLNGTAMNLTPLNPEHLEEIADWWRRDQRLHPLAPGLLRERLFPPEAHEPDLLIGLRDERERLVGLAAGEFPARWGESTGGVRWLGLSPPALAGGGLGPLLGELERRLTARGARKLYLHATPPYYIRPGVDTRDTALIVALLELGWRHEETHFNLTVDLAAWAPPEASAIWGSPADAAVVRRATPADATALASLIEQHWSPGWRRESALGFGHDPISVFVAETAGGLVGFSAYEVSQCDGSFGPTGVVAGQRGQGLGRRLLWACLSDLKRLGRSRCEIGWVGPVPFYHRACGATLGPTFWMMTRELAQPGN